MLPKNTSDEVIQQGLQIYKKFELSINIYHHIECKSLSEIEKLERIKKMYILTNDKSFIIYMESISHYINVLNLLNLMVVQGNNFISQCQPENAHIIEKEVSQKEKIYNSYLTYTKNYKKYIQTTITSNTRLCDDVSKIIIDYL